MTINISIIVSRLAFAQDIFQESSAKDLHSQDAWDWFRYGILEYGGSHPDQLREPNYNALQESLLL